jgi:transcriptional regulator with XRE-family HTH domain
MESAWMHCAFSLDTITLISDYKYVMAITEGDFKWQELGDRINRRRVARKISQQTLASSAGLTQNAIYRLEAGETNPQLSTLQRIAPALECSVRELLCGMSENAPRLGGRLNRVRLVVESGDEAAIRILDHGIEAAEVLLERSSPKHPASSPERKMILKGDRRQSAAHEFLWNNPISKPKSEADDMPSMTVDRIKLGGKTVRRLVTKRQTE